MDLYAAPELQIDGNSYTGKAWSGLNGQQNCANWTSNVMFEYGTAGTPGTTDQWFSGPQWSCSTETRFYCINEVTVVPTTTTTTTKTTTTPTTTTKTTTKTTTPTTAATTTTTSTTKPSPSSPSTPSSQLSDSSTTLPPGQTETHSQSTSSSSDINSKPTSFISTTITTFYDLTSIKVTLLLLLSLSLLFCDLIFKKNNHFSLMFLTMNRIHPVCHPSL